MTEPWRSTATVRTDAAPRYVKQLVSHLDRLAEVRTEPDGERLGFGAGSCLISAGPDAVLLFAEATTSEGLTHVQDVVGRHLERFGQRHELEVRWTPN